MSIQHTSARTLDGVTRRGVLGAVATVPLFTATLFLSALLLFLVQPLFAKMLLPLLGGSPGVWNTAMVCYQALLLAGYSYAHLSVHLLTPRRQVLLHLALLTLAALALPIAIGGGWSPPVENSPIPWLIAVLAVSIGMPFFVVSATAPLLQRWFSATGHAAAADPYFLYAASNLGSMLALLGYPTLIEPWLPLAAQSSLWTWAYGLLAVLIALCGMAFQSAPTAAQPLAEGAATLVRSRPASSWRERTRWIALAAIPSSLLLGVTSVITTDIASVPLLWVVPLALYLLTFVIVFARRPLLRHRWMTPIFPYVLAFVAVNYLLPLSAAIKLPAHLVLFFVTAMICHGELARRRPGSQDLTGFYLCLSLGGVIGGVFSAILAPMIFNGVYEYPIALVLACLVLPREGKLLFVWRDLAMPVALAVPLLAVLAFQDTIAQQFGTKPLLLAFSLVGILICLFRKRPLRLALGTAILFATALSVDVVGSAIHQERGFFGVVRLELAREGRLMLMFNGMTIHGAEYVDAAHWREPLFYYHPSGPAGQLIKAIETQHQKLDQIAVVGLGSGAMSCYAEPGQSWTFFEIDPMVVRLARNPRYLHFLEQCGAESKIVLGDGRLSLQKAPDHAFDLIVLDAFSSDAIPTHLLTKEALALYLQKLTNHGVVLYHISNRHLALAPVLANIAADAGVVASRQSFMPSDDQDETPSEWMALARTADDLAFLAQDPRWEQLAGMPAARPWSDDYSNLLGAMRH